MIALGLLADPLIRYWRVISANPERGGMIPQAPRRPTGRGARKSREGRDREWLAGVVAMLHDVLEDADEEALAPVASWLSDEEAEALRLLTRERGSYDEYVERIATAGNRIAVLVKRREGAGLWPQPLSGWQRPSDRFVRLPLSGV